MESNIVTWLPYIFIAVLGFLATALYNSFNKAIENLNKTIVELNKTVGHLGERISHIEGKIN
jgi:hypothetical protein